MRLATLSFRRRPRAGLVVIAGSSSSSIASSRILASRSIDSLMLDADSPRSGAPFGPLSDRGRAGAPTGRSGSPAKRAFRPTRVKVLELVRRRRLAGGRRDAGTDTEASACQPTGRTLLVVPFRERARARPVPSLSRIAALAVRPLRGLRQAIARAEAMRGNAARPVSAPTLCLCTSRARRGLAARMLLVRSQSRRERGPDARRE